MTEIVNLSNNVPFSDELGKESIFFLTLVSVFKYFKKTALVLYETLTNKI